MATRKPKPVQAGPFIGINNKLPVDQLTGRDAGDFVRDAVNVDVTEAGTLQRRPGTTQVVQGTNCRSLWADGEGAFYADGIRLMRFDGAAAQEVGQVTAADVLVSFTATPRGVVWSDGTLLQLIAEGVSGALAIPMPNPEPLATAAPGGALAAGSYLVAFAHVTPAGERSAITPFTELEVPANGRITVAMPAAAALDIEVYVSPVNGGQLFLEDVLPSGATSRVLPILTSDGTPVADEVEACMPPGTIVRHHRGRLLTVFGSVLVYSAPYAYGIYHPAKNFIALDGDITLCEPVPGGVYLATASKTYFIPGGDIAAGSLDQVAPFGAVPGSDARDPVSLAVWWMSDRGAVRAGPAGTLELPQDAAVAFGKASAGASVLREENGLSQFLSVTSNTVPTGAISARSYIDARVVN